MEELLSLKWNNHRSTFIHVLGILRAKQLYTDATIACDGKFYSVHKLVLSTCSDYFSAILDRTNCKNPVIVLKDIKSDDLEALLDYMYLGEVNVRQSDLATLIKAAECLCVKGLAVPDDEPSSKKVKGCENQSRRTDVSDSPPAKRKKYIEDDGRETVRPRQEVKRLSSIHTRPKSPLASFPISQSPVLDKGAAENNVSILPATSPHQKVLNSEHSLSNKQDDNQGDGNCSEQTDMLVKVEMDDGVIHNVETYDISNNEEFKEEGEDGTSAEAGGGESVGDLSNDLPDFLQQTSSGPLQGNAFVNTPLSGSTSFSQNDVPTWSNDGSNLGFPHLNFGSTEESGQSNSQGISCQQSQQLQRTIPNQAEGSVLSSTAAANSQYQSGRPRKNGYTCTFCGRWFYRNAEMERHIRTHTGERPFQCPVCPYSASRKSTLQCHMFNIHQQKL